MNSSLKTQPLLRGEGLVVDFPDKHGGTLRALDQVDFDLYPGEILGVVGESGSGKTTLGRVVADFLKPTSGRIEVAAEGQPTPRRATGRGDRKVQMIFQESAAALNPRLPIWRTVGEGFSPGRLPLFSQVSGSRLLRSRVAEELRLVGLDESYLDKRATELSGGEKQRVSIARALAASPVALVCDEAVSALDVSIRAVVLNLFQRVRDERGTALFFISHDISVVAHLADRVVVMYGGKVVEAGPTEQVVLSPEHEYTRSLIASIPSFEREVSV